jgi:tRNA(Ile)-lysidine synthase
VSGGADSTALLVALRRLAAESRLELRAAHLHHGLRGAEADADLRFVRALCARLGVPLTAARWDARARMRRRGLSGQDGLRVLRGEFLAAAAHRAGAGTIVTAHTADDQLETLLMRLGRGTGLTGLAGMRPAVRRTDAAGRRLLWIKPLLGATRAMIEADLVAAGPTLRTCARRGFPGSPPWREDRSNLDPRYTRSRVRHQAVPALARALLPRASAARARELLALRAVRAATAACASEHALARLAARILPAPARTGRHGVTLPVEPLDGLPPALRRAVLARLWRHIGPRATGLTDRHFTGLERLIDTGRGGAIIQLPGGWTAERDREVVRFRGAAATRGIHAQRGAPARVGLRPATATRLRPPGRLDWGGDRIEARWTTGAVARRRLRAVPAASEYFDAGDIRGPLVVRRARSNERFTPFGRTRATRLGRFLSKQQASRQVRRHPTVLADAGGILWVVGVRRSARAPVTAGTRKALRVHAERHD